MAVNYSELYSFVLRQKITSYQVTQMQHLHELFSLPMPEIAYQQLLEVEELLHQGVLSDKYR